MTAQNKKVALKSLVLSAGISIFYIFACWYSVSQFGSVPLLSVASLFLGLFTIVAITTMLYVITKVIAISLHLTPRDYSKVSAAALFCAIFAVVLILDFRAGNWIRYRGFQSIVANSRPLVQAVQKYQEKYNFPPDTLDKLEPDFVNSIPGTGIGAYPCYDLLLSRDGLAYGGNSWILVVPVSTDSATYDMLLYFPNHHYPEKYIAARFGDWALIQMGSASAKENGLAVSN
jgi:hypothetical protein